MTRLREWLLRFWGTLRRSAGDREIEEELRAHLELAAEQMGSRGAMPPNSQDEARRMARLEYGGVTQAAESMRDQRGFPWIADLASDLRYALRTLRRTPGFAAAAIAVLALGIGANAAVFSVVNSILLKPLSYPNPEELVAIWNRAPGATGIASIAGQMRLSGSMFFSYSEHNQAFKALGIWMPGAATVTGLAEPEQVRTVFLSDGVLQALNVLPALGGWLSSTDQEPGGAGSVMLGYGYWLRRFGGDLSVVGRSITVDSRPRRIAGVMPQGFRLVTEDFDLLAPFAFDRSQLRLAGFSYLGVGRLKPGVSIPQAQSSLARILPVWINSWPIAPRENRHDYETWGITPVLRPLKEDVTGSLQNVLWVVMGMIGIVMLIACANVASLLLVRTESRQQELAVRTALGAGKARITRLLLAESVSLAILGGAAGLGLANLALRVLLAIGPANLPRLHEISLDARALGFTAVLSLLSGIFFGLIAAWKYAFDGPLGMTTRTMSASRERRQARSLLVVVQTAMAFVLLISAGLMIRTFQALRKIEPGFTRPEQLQILRISIPESLIPEPERVARTQYDLVQKLAAIPGVASAAFTSAMPMERFDDDRVDLNLPTLLDVRAETKPSGSGDVPLSRIYKYISPGLFRATGTRIVAGRDFSWEEFHGRRPVAIVSENLARELWGGPESALGKRIATGPPTAPWREVVGAVEDVRNNGVQEPAPTIAYWPSYSESLFRPGAVRALRSLTFVIRSSRAGTEGLLTQIRQAVGSVNGNLPAASIRTMQEVYGQSLARISFTLAMLAIAGAMALLLGIAGIYGVISYVVSQRTREIGIRVALGAESGEIKRMFVRHGLLLAGTGIFCGLGVAAALTQVMKSLLFGVGTLDPVTYAAVPFILATAAALASYFPARRAAAVDPAETLRAE